MVVNMLDCDMEVNKFKSELWSGYFLHFPSFVPSERPTANAGGKNLQGVR